MIHDVVAVVAPPVAAFELGVLAEVFGLDRSEEGLPSYRFAVATARPGLLPTSSGFSVLVEDGLDRLESADLVAVPSWPVHDAVPPPELVAALHGAVARGARVLSVCSGAFLLAAAGLLDGRRAVTHWRWVEELARRAPRSEVDASVLHVSDGPITTSAGTAAALDACLQLVRQAHGSDVANRLARRMVVAPFREGGQAQYAETPLPTVRSHGGLGPVLDRVLARLDEPWPVRRLAREALVSPRTFARLFRAATGTTPGRWLLEARVQHAERLLETTDLPVGVVAARCGLGSADTVRRQLTARRGVGPSVYRRTFRGAGASP